MRKIKVYAVVKTCENREEMMNNIYTIVKTKKQANEYILFSFYNEYFSPFSYWCELHNQNVKDLDVFRSFMFTRYDEEEINKYTVIPITYALDQLCALIRTLAEFYPMGTSYETEVEVQQFLNKHKKDEKKENC